MVCFISMKKNQLRKSNLPLFYLDVIRLIFLFANFQCGKFSLPNIGCQNLTHGVKFYSSCKQQLYQLRISWMSNFIAAVNQLQLGLSAATARIFTKIWAAAKFDFFLKLCYTIKKRIFFGRILRKRKFEKSLNFQYTIYRK